MAEINPYQPPQASVADVVADAGALAAEPRSVDAGHAIGWLSRGWSLFRQAPLIWIAISVIGLIAFMFLAWIPIVGQLGTTLLSILFAGGLMLGCRTLERGDELTIAHLFAGFQSHLSPLLVIGALYLAAVFVLVVAVSLVSGGTIFALMRGNADIGAALGSVMFALLVAVVVMIPLAMAIWFAPALTVLHELQPVAAMKLSFRGCLRNMVAFLVYGVVLFILAILATIPFGLGWLVLLPVMIGSVYASYQDIFLRQ